MNLSLWFAQQPPDSARVDLATGDVTHDDLRKIRALGFGHVRFGVDPEHPRFIPLDLDSGSWAHG